MNIALGNNKPELLLEVEKIVWRALFVMSEGLHFPEDIVDQLFLQIPWQKLQLNSSQWDWFNIRAPPAAAAPRPGLLLVPTAPQIPMPPSLSAPPLPDVMDTALDPNMQVTPPPLSASPLPDVMDTTLDPDMQVTPPSSSVSPLPNVMDTTLDPDMQVPPPLSAPPLPEVQMDTTLDPKMQVAIPDPNEVDAHVDSNQLFSTDVNGQSTEVHKPVSPGLMEDDALLGLRSTADRDVASPKSPSEATMTRRSARLTNTNKEKAAEQSADSRVSLTSGIPTRTRHPKTRKKSMDPKQIDPENVPVTALKRKEPPEVEGLLSAGSSASRPIDVDALNAILERFPVKRELQVSDCKMPSAID